VAAKILCDLYLTHLSSVDSFGCLLSSKSMAWSCFVNFLVELK
jgi:hypothetical protein